MQWSHTQNNNLQDTFWAPNHFVALFANKKKGVHINNQMANLNLNQVKMDETLFQSKKRVRLSDFSDPSDR